jgi:outer membrane protein OmpA-like peptidoglycan-associated protein
MRVLEACSFKACVGLAVAFGGCKPTPPGSYPAKGPPAVAVTARPLAAQLAAPKCDAQITTRGDLKFPNEVEFEKGQASIRLSPTSEETLKCVVDFLDRNKIVTRFRIEGHTEFNDYADWTRDITLSQQRGEAIVAWIVAHGINPERVWAKGYGPTRPIAMYGSASAPRNERVEFYVEELNGTTVTRKELALAIPPTSRNLASPSLVPTTTSASEAQSTVVSVPTRSKPSPSYAASASPASARQLPISTQSDSQSILNPISCSLDGDIVIAKGTFRTTPVPDDYRRVHAQVRLYVYCPPSEGFPGGFQCGRVGEEYAFMMIGNGPWTVSVPVSADDTPTRCEVTAFPTRELVPVVPALPSHGNEVIRPHELPISVEREDPIEEYASDESILAPTSCILRNGMAVATGTFNGNVSGFYLRASKVVELYVYSLPRPDSPGGIQLADLSREHPPFVRGEPWSVAVPVSNRLGTPARCQVALR